MAPHFMGHSFIVEILFKNRNYLQRPFCGSTPPHPELMLSSQGTGFKLGVIFVGVLGSAKGKLFNRLSIVAGPLP